MKQKETRDLLIRNIPIEVYNLLEKAAKEHHRSKTQEAIVALTTGLSIARHRLKQPVPFKWKTKITNNFIENAIKEGRDDCS